MKYRLFVRMFDRCKQDGFKYGALFALCVFGSACVSNYPNEIERSSSFKRIDKTYPLVYEINNGNYQHYKALSVFIPGQDSVIIESDKQWEVIDLITKDRVKTVELARMAVDFRQLSKTNNRLLIAIGDPELKRDPKVQIWDTQSWTLLNTFDGGGTSLSNIGLSPDGRLLFMSHALWSVKSGEKLIGMELDTKTGNHTFSSDNRYFVASTLSNGTQLVDIKTRKDYLTRTRDKEIDKILS